MGKHDIKYIYSGKNGCRVPVTQDMFGGIQMVFEQLRDLICEMLDVDENAVTMDSVILEDFDADSLDLVEIVMGVEEQFGIEIPDNAIEEFHTVGDVVRYIEDHT